MLRTVPLCMAQRLPRACGPCALPARLRLLTEPAARSLLLALHRTAVLRHDEFGQETLLNLLLRNYLHYNLYDQARPRPGSPGLRRGPSFQPAQMPQMHDVGVEPVSGARNALTLCACGG